MKLALFAVMLVTLTRGTIPQPPPTLTPQQAPAPAFYFYRAETSCPVLRSGDVLVSGMRWRCAGKVCTASGPWQRPSSSTCLLLARQVGKMISFGRPGAMLSYEELITCNGGYMGTGGVPGGWCAPPRGP